MVKELKDFFIEKNQFEDRVSKRIAYCAVFPRSRFQLKELNQLFFQ